MPYSYCWRRSRKKLNVFHDAKIIIGERTLNNLHLKFTATGNNNLSDQFRIDVLPSTIH